jgi:hypothetical protein
VQVLRVTTKPKRLREIDKHVKVRPSTVKKVLSSLQHDPVLTLIKIETEHPRNMVEQHNWQLTVGTRSLT